MQVYSNLNENNMVNEIKKHLKYVTNKEYKKNCIDLHYKYKLINKEEYNELLKYIEEV